MHDLAASCEFSSTSKRRPAPAGRGEQSRIRHLGRHRAPQRNVFIVSKMQRKRLVGRPSGRGAAELCANQLAKWELRSESGSTQLGRPFRGAAAGAGNPQCPNGIRSALPSARDPAAQQRRLASPSRNAAEAALVHGPGACNSGCRRGFAGSAHLPRQLQVDAGWASAR